VAEFSFPTDVEGGGGGDKDADAISASWNII